ncbi:2'-(5''-triphosphoribosyl)-3-dephospho-CoA synthase [Roseomonas mucosa]|uniref:Probable 2-(5''-triphosphoribosyl)-3'-dephosphocoenzyme-A synthase n=1 Tax=Roseomonas mucosa TaxID=207340 RepID=A0A379N2T5_9PROT|nr:MULTISPECIES: triphosphoribosyl-dephospho-CoA synthase MdcB [Roseomonas]MBS5904044.1 triphosphoribosyl-dephospho-CoA synthase MdcB [Acetobacteraceae bacterium]ATR21384.1 triphosphoribosyl-dephospho-CoA synthase MdcB [Roseomonas sp. FDAARGOS_362]MCG7350620.1 triphosphoribosyl-dephospho-CoA synthase MdcB [Roseomonas mucosa]MCG7358104.1 triphosphoribosyl-dephospho-CoA synthase MdcB [Roseomonas mucosa]MDT8290255.1 triphosphoribosyl-dephospho-CoA synthase MdcB [Roseomonas mucosa]
MSFLRPLPQALRAEAARIGGLAARCLVLEVETWPKPGLVSHVDNGSHTDMDAGSFRRSAAAIEPFLARLALAGIEGASMPRLRAIGLEAEGAMLRATGGVNTHRGAIFGLGLLCAAAGARLKGAQGTLGDVVERLWGGEILGTPSAPDSHGGCAARRHGAGGARQEAAAGFPTLYHTGLPALRQGARLAPGDDEAARVQSCFALIATLGDTNLLHRGGAEGLAFAQWAARGFLEGGGVGRPGWRAAAAGIGADFVARRLSPGGSADLLAMSLFLRAMEAA